jgi:hypothetical protein
VVSSWYVLLFGVVSLQSFSTVELLACAENSTCSRVLIVPTMAPTEMEVQYAEMEELSDRIGESEEWKAYDKAVEDGITRLEDE